MGTTTTFTSTCSTYTLTTLITILLYISAAFPIHCEANGTPQFFRSRLPRKIVLTDEDVSLPDSSSNTEPYEVGSPFTLPPFDSLPPISLPDTTSPPFCINPPSYIPPQTPSTAIPSPTGYTPTPTFSQPPPPPYYYIPPILPFPSPPPGPAIPGPSPSTPAIGISPPPYFEPGPSPPSSITPSPPSYSFPSPPTTPVGGGGPGLSPPRFLPPIIYPAPTTPPPPNTGPSLSLWCVAKPSVPDPIIQEAMNYACGSGADCASIQPDGSCFEPNNLFAHASYAFNSYWQRTKVAGGTCSFGDTAMLVTVDPSYDGCHFLYL